MWAPWRLAFIMGHRDVKGCVLCTIPQEQKDDANFVVHRSAHSFTVLNRYPYNSGHLMVVPYAHTNDLSSLSDEALLDLQRSIRDAIGALQQTMKPHGFNVGMNLGEAGGAGIRDHLHYHIVPRWNGDTNFMPVFGEVKILPEAMDDTFKRLASAYRK
jgi:ATP adenylyltransferase